MFFGGLIIVAFREHCMELSYSHWGFYYKTKTAGCLLRSLRVVL